MQNKKELGYVFENSWPVPLTAFSDKLTRIKLIAIKNIEM